MVAASLRCVRAFLGSGAREERARSFSPRSVRRFPPVAPAAAPLRWHAAADGEGGADGCDGGGGGAAAGNNGEASGGGGAPVFASAGPVMVEFGAGTGELSRRLAADAEARGGGGPLGGQLLVDRSGGAAWRQGQDRWVEREPRLASGARLRNCNLALGPRHRPTLLPALGQNLCPRGDSPGLGTGNVTTRLAAFPHA